MDNNIEGTETTGGCAETDIKAGETGAGNETVDEKIASQRKKHRS